MQFSKLVLMGACLLVSSFVWATPGPHRIRGGTGHTDPGDLCNSYSAEGGCLQYSNSDGSISTCSADDGNGGCNSWSTTDGAGNYEGQTVCTSYNAQGACGQYAGDDGSTSTCLVYDPDGTTCDQWSN